MAQSMPRNATPGQPSELGVRPPPGIRRVLVLALWVASLLVSLGADQPLPERPAGQPAALSVAMALELALLAEGDWDSTPGSLEQARALFGRPDLVQAQVRDLAIEAARSWSGRTEPARRLYLAWIRVQRADERLATLEVEGAVGQLARTGLVAEFCGALGGSTHLPPNQAVGLLATSAATHDAVFALERVGAALEAIVPTTLLGAHQLVAWRTLLAVARVPGPVADLRIPRAQGLPLERPVAPLIRVEPERVILSSRALVSWSKGQLVVDQGPVAESLDSWSPSSWQRWQAIARRRSELSLAGITVLPPADAHRAGQVLTPNIAADPDLPVERLVQIMGSLHAEGVEQLCLLVRPAEHLEVRQVCVPFVAGVPTGGVVWRLGPGGLYTDQLPSGGQDAWVVEQPGARVEDLVLALEEAHHAGRSLGLAAREGI